MPELTNRIYRELAEADRPLATSEVVAAIARWCRATNGTNHGRQSVEDALVVMSHHGAVERSGEPGARFWSPLPLPDDRDDRIQVWNIIHDAWRAKRREPR